MEAPLKVKLSALSDAASLLAGNISSHEDLAEKSAAVLDTYKRLKNYTSQNCA